jgi:hypothetical protein
VLKQWARHLLRLLPLSRHGIAKAKYFNYQRTDGEESSGRKPIARHFSQYD